MKTNPREVMDWVRDFRRLLLIHLEGRLSKDDLHRVRVEADEAESKILDRVIDASIERR